MINSVEEYLSELRRELSGCSSATIQNALADSEEHLRTALESDPDLQSVIERYGSPEEIAANYKDIDEGAPEVPLVTKQIAEQQAAVKASRTRTYSVIWIVVGTLAVLFSLALLLAGGSVLWVDNTLTDDDGFFMSDTIQMSRNTYAIISEPAEIELGLSRAFDLGVLASFKGEIESNQDGNVFVGVARQDDVEAYLRDVQHEEITGLQIENAKWSSEPVPGTSQPAPPLTQNFWAQSANGPGVQSFEWEPETGTWVFVIMNEDGSEGIDVDTKIGAAVPWLVGAGVGLLIVGAVLLVAGGIMIILAVRKYRHAAAGRQGSGGTA